MTAEKSSMDKEIQEKERMIASLRPKLQNIIEASKPVQDLLNLNYEHKFFQTESASCLPKPLFYVYVLVLAYNDLYPDDSVDVFIDGDFDQARQDQAVVTLRLFYSLTLDIISVKCSVHLSSEIVSSVSLAGDVFSEETLLGFLFPDDSGKCCPSLTSSLKLRHINFVVVSSIFGSRCCYNATLPPIGKQEAASGRRLFSASLSSPIACAAQGNQAALERYVCCGCIKDLSEDMKDYMLSIQLQLLISRFEVLLEAGYAYRSEQSSALAYHSFQRKRRGRDQEFPFRTGSDSVADWYLRHRSVGLCQPLWYRYALGPRLAEGNEQVLIADFSQSASAPNSVRGPWWLFYGDFATFSTPPPFSTGVGTGKDGVPFCFIL
ncbi:unnamed protein product [Soboliphyme baturini]|uniref:FACT complex subunit n=1 Tax=Soboliphyme baturini TaxID=241478 RepID=A0A183ITF4_9BILA|nr:unnamed protein product [Soboliphyme baturini]